MIAIRRMAREEIARVAELDAEDSGAFYYRQAGRRIERVEKAWRNPRWDPAECARRVAAIASGLDRGDVALGAFDGETLVGLGTVRFRIAPGTAQLLWLWVSRSHRRRGIAARLTTEMERLARADGATTFYVSAAPTEAGQAFYSSCGFRPTDRPIPELLALEPDDVHMTKGLR